MASETRRIRFSKRRYPTRHIRGGAPIPGRRKAEEALRPLLQSGWTIARVRSERFNWRFDLERA